MKLSKQTCAILKNFSAINKSILIRKGNVQSTISTDKSVLGIARIEEDFPQGFGIFDIHKFLSAVDLLDDPEIEFDESSLILHSKNRRLTYQYADTSLLSTHAALQKNKIHAPKGGVKFHLSQEDIKSINEAANILRLPTISFFADGGSIGMKVFDSENPNSNGFMIDIQAETTATMDVAFSVDRFCMMSGNYDVSIFQQGEHIVCGYFRNVSKSLEYWVAAEEDYIYDFDEGDLETANAK